MLEKVLQEAAAKRFSEDSGGTKIKVLRLPKRDDFERDRLTLPMLGSNVVEPEPNIMPHFHLYSNSEDIERFSREHWSSDQKADVEAIS
ncbi:hypothetical protein BGX28_001763 [Mortierella sp. GBA30]|nr:hypothetical protein BGX28_001763 [Mortierella sp. GBA30]